MKEARFRRRLAGLKAELDEARAKLDEARAKAALYDEVVEDAGDCWVGQTLMIKHEPNDLEPASRLYFLRITEDEAYRIDMGGYAHLEVWED